MMKTSNVMYYGKCWTAVGRSLAVAAVAVALAAGSWCAAQDKEAVLHTFTGVEGGSSEDPGGGLTFNASGDLFGTTSTGGVGEFADGTVFEMTPKAGGGFTFQTIHQFSQATGDQPVRV
jgi:hypothetical protein